MLFPLGRNKGIEIFDGDILVGKNTYYLG